MKKSKLDPRNKGFNRHVSLLLTAEVQEKLNTLKESSGMPLTVILRRALDSYITAQEKQ